MGSETQATTLARSKLKKPGSPGRWQLQSAGERMLQGRWQAVLQGVQVQLAQQGCTLGLLAHRAGRMPRHCGCSPAAARC